MTLCASVWAGKPSTSPQIHALTEPSIVSVPADYLRTTECGLVLDDNGYISQPDFVVTALEAGRGETWRCDGIEAFGICGSDEYYDYWAEADVEFTVTCPSNRITYSGVLAWRQYLNSCKDTFKDDIKDLYGDASCPAGKTTITAIPLDDTASFNPETGYFKFNGYSGKVQIPLTLLLNGGTSVDKGHDEYLGYNERAMPLPALGEGTRKLARPILFIHGIGDEHTVWGVNDSLDENYETSVDHDTWKQGLVSAYDQGSAPDVIAYTYGLDVSTEGDDPSQWGINENGLFFFNGNDKDSSWTTQWIDPWWTADDGGEGQSQQLYNRMSEILTDWYGDSWTTDSSMKIDLVTHSQGGLVVRDLFNNAASAGGTALSNPANHVRKVVTLDAPHLGTALSTDPDLMPSKFSSVGDLAAGLDTVAYANHTLVKVTIDDDILESITEFSLKMAGIRNSNLDAISDVLGLSGGLASLNGFLTGWNDLSFTLKGGYLGNYKGTFKIDLLLTTLSYSTTINSPKKLRKRLEDYGKSRHLASVGSDWITNLKFYPTKPDGTPVRLLPLYSPQVSLIVPAAIEEIGGSGTSFCENNSDMQDQPSCFAVEDFLDAKASSYALGMDLVDVDVDGDLFPMFDSLQNQWMANGDVAVEAASQKFVSEAAGITTQNYPGYFEEPRDYIIQKTLSSDPYQQTLVHGGSNFRNLGGHGFSLAPEAGYDVFCALDDYCSENILTGEPVAVLDSILMLTVLASTTSDADSVSANAAMVQFDGDFDVSGLALNGEGTSGLAVVDSTGKDLVTIGFQPDEGVFVTHRHSDGSRSTQAILNPEKTTNFQVKRIASVIILNAVRQDGVTASDTVDISSLGVGDRLGVATFTTETQIARPMLIAASGTLVHPENQEPAPTAQSLQTDSTHGVVVVHREAAQSEANLSRPRFFLLNKSDSVIEGFKLYYYFKADSARNPQVALDWAPNQSSSLEHLGGDNWRMVVDGSNATLQSGEPFPGKEGDQFRIFYEDQTRWYLWNDWSNNHNYGLPKINARIEVRDLQGNLLWGAAPDLDSLDSALAARTPQVRVYTRDEGINETNVEKIQAQVINTSGAALSGYHLEYYFRVKSGKTLSSLEEWPTVAQASPTLKSLGCNLWRVDWTFGTYILYPGDTTTSGMVGLHYTDWSTWDKTNDPSYLASSDYTENDSVVLRAADGSVVWGSAPDTASCTESSDGSVDSSEALSASNLQVELRDESPDESNHLKPRVRVTNNGDQTVGSFRLGMNYTTEDGLTPEIEVWSVPYCTVTNNALTDSTWRVLFDCSGLSLETGEIWPDQAGAVFGLHYGDWSDWDRSNDAFMVGITEDWSITSQVSVSGVYTP